MNTNNNSDDEPNVYNKKINEFLNEIPGRIYVFEITKFCGYSTFIFMYKDETLLDLWSRVSHHFSCNDIKGLYIDNCLNTSNNEINDNDDTINIIITRYVMITINAVVALIRRTNMYRFPCQV